MIEIQFSDNYIERHDSALVDFADWYKNTKDDAVAFNHNAVLRLWNWLEANEGKMWFGEDGDLDSIEGLPDEVVGLIKEIVEVRKPKQRFWVTLSVDAWAVDDEYIKSAVEDALEHLHLDRGAEDIKIEPYS